MENKRPVRLSWIAVLVVVLLLSASAYFIATRIVSASFPRLSDAISIPANANQVIKPLGDGLIFYDGGTLHAIDGRGRQIWSHPAGSLAEFSVSDGGVATWSGTMLSLLNPQNGTPLYSGNQESNIISARLGKSYAAVQIEQAGNETKVLTDAQREHNSVMLLLDPSGRQVDKIELRSQTVLDYGFFNNDQLFWTMVLNTEGTVPICTINSYKPNRSMLSGSFSDTQQLLYSASFQPNRIRVVGLKYIKDFDYLGKEIAADRMLVYGWSMVAMDEGQADPMMVLVPDHQADGSTGITDLRTIRGQDDHMIRLPSEAKQLFASGDTVYAFSNDRVMVCRWGALQQDIYALTVQIDKVIALTDNHSAIVTSGSSVYLIPLP